MKSAWMVFLTLILVGILGGTCFAQYDPDGLFQFSRYWQQEPADETSYDLNLNSDAIIDATDLLRLIAGWKRDEFIITLPGGVTMDLVRIPAGSYLMGRDPGELDSNTNEDPQHPVTIAQDFYLGKFEVTQAQWLALMGSWPDNTYNPDNYSLYGLGDNYPAYFVSWNDCENFVTELNKLGQGTFRLPSEAEWEYVCRAGTTTRFSFGDSDSCGPACDDCAAGALPGNRSDYMWYCGNNGSSETPQYGTKPVGGGLPNGFGLYDMHGNVWEWCQDYWHGDYSGAPTDGSAWQLPTNSYRVLRGGDWSNDAQYCRSARRIGNDPDDRRSNRGVRVVWTP